jgi:glycosyltransferase involved in cell wall biosynthesis
MPVASEIRIAPWPEDHGNPYQELFYGALAPHGVRVVEGLTINDLALRKLASDVDIIHLHWPEYAWRVQGDSMVSELRLIVGLARFLRLARRLGLRVWWTAHNIVPHEGRRIINFLGYRAVAANADLVIAHSKFAAGEVTRKYGHHNVVVMPIGNFADVYPRPRPRELVMRELGLDPALPLVACLGAVRRYKGIATAIDAVAALGGKVQLLVAGDPKPDVDAAQMMLRAQRTPWLKVLFRRLTDQEFSDFTAASEALILSYSRATTSAVLLTAWTLGRGVVASDLRCFADELSGHPSAGVLARPGDALGFANAIEEYLSLARQDRIAAALEAAQEHAWSRCVTPVVEALQTSGNQP